MQTEVIFNILIIVCLLGGIGCFIMFVLLMIAEKKPKQSKREDDSELGFEAWDGSSFDDD